MHHSTKSFDFLALYSSDGNSMECACFCFGPFLRMKFHSQVGDIFLLHRMLKAYISVCLAEIHLGHRVLYYNSAAQDLYFSTMQISEIL